MNTSQALWLMVGQFQLLLALGWTGALRWSTPESVMALRCMAGFNLLSGISLALISLRGMLDDILTTMGSDLCAALAFILLWRAGEAFFTKGRGVNNAAQFLALVVGCAGILWFGQSPEQGRYRVLALYVTIGGVCTWSGWRGCLTLWAKGDRWVGVALAVGGTALSLCLLWRGILGLSDGEAVRVEVDTPANRGLAHLVLLGVVLTNVVFVYFLMTRIVRRLNRMSRRDALTGLLNRRALFESLDREWDRAGRTGAPFCVMCLDIDHFKSVNDSYGHPAGDAVLARLGTVLVQTLRGSDVVGRTGGEEFIALLVDTDAADAGAIAERLRLAMAEDAALRPSPTRAVTASIGIAEIGPGDCSSRDLVTRADGALYAAKRAGRNRVMLAPAAAVPDLAPPPALRGVG